MYFKWSETLRILQKCISLVYTLQVIPEAALIKILPLDV